MTTPTVVSLPVIDPSSHSTHFEKEENADFHNFSNPFSKPKPETKTMQNSPVTISPPALNTTPSQPRNNTRNIFTPISGSSSLRGSIHPPNDQYPQPSLDHLIQSSPLVNLLRKNARNIRPWTEFFNFYYFQTPNWDMMWPRMIKNLRYFIYNYTIIYTSMLLLCVILMPILLLLIVLFIVIQSFLLFQGDTVYIGRIFAFSKRMARWLILIIFTIAFFLTVRPVVFFLLTATYIAIVAHGALHIGQKYDKLPDEDSFDDDV